MKGTFAFQIAPAFAKHWDFVYEIPKTMLIDNGPQFNPKFLLQVQSMIGVKHNITTTYHPKENGQTVRCN